MHSELEKEVSYLNNGATSYRQKTANDNMDLWKASIPTLATEGLYLLAKDAEARIGSHIAGGSPVDGYIESQRHLLTLIQNELENRSK